MKPVQMLGMSAAFSALLIFAAAEVDAQRGAAIATTAAVMGSYYSTLPGGCVTVVRVGINYSRCGATWYQPVYSGANVQYQVVSEP